MAEAIGIDKDKPNKACTVAVKMLKGKSSAAALNSDHFHTCAFKRLMCYSSFTAIITREIPMRILVYTI